MEKIKLKSITNGWSDEAYSKVAVDETLDLDTRFKALAYIKKPEYLEQIVLNNDLNLDIRFKAIKRLGEPCSKGVLKRVALNQSVDCKIRAYALECSIWYSYDVVSEMIDIVLNTEADNFIRSEALDIIKDKIELEQVELYSSNFIRYEDLERITDDESLRDIAMNDCEDIFTRYEAIKRISSEEILKQIALNDEVYYKARIKAFNKLKMSNEELKQLVINISNFAIQSSLIAIITDDKILREIVVELDNSIHNYHVHKKCIEMISNENVLRDIIVDCRIDFSSKYSALKKIADEEMLLEIVLDDNIDSQLHYNAIDQITNEKILEKIVLSDIYEGYKKRALVKITDGKFLEKVALNPNIEFNVRIEVIRKTETPMELFKKIALDANEETNTRCAAINEITDDKFIKEFTLNEDVDLSIRFYAIEKIDRIDIIESIISLSTNEEIILIAKEKKEFLLKKFNKITAQKALVSLAINSNDSYLRALALSKITAPKNILKVATESEYEDTRENALEILSEEELQKIVLSNSYRDFRHAALGLITNEEILLKIVLNKKKYDSDYEIKSSAVEKITNEEFLKKIATEEELSVNIKKIALKKLNR